MRRGAISQNPFVPSPTEPLGPILAGAVTLDVDDLDASIDWYRDVLVWKQLAQPALLTNRDRQDQIERVASGFSDAALGARIAAIEEAKESLKGNGHPRLVLEKLFLSFGHTPIPTR